MNDDFNINNSLHNNNQNVINNEIQPLQNPNQPNNLFNRIPNIPLAPNTIAQNPNPRMIPNRNIPNMNNIPQNMIVPYRNRNQNLPHNPNMNILNNRPMPNDNQPMNQNLANITNQQLQLLNLQTIQRVQREQEQNHLQEQRQRANNENYVNNLVFRNNNNNNNPPRRNTNQLFQATTNRMNWLQRMGNFATLLITHCTTYSNWCAETRFMYGANCNPNANNLQREILSCRVSLDKIRREETEFVLDLDCLRNVRLRIPSNHRAGCTCYVSVEERRVMGLVDRALGSCQDILRENGNVRRIVIAFRDRCNRMIGQRENNTGVL